MISRRKWLFRLLVVAIMTGVGIGLWKGLRPPSISSSPPEISGSIPDPEVLEALTRARDDVSANPHSPQAWGEYGLLLRAHGLDSESDVCFAEAARLDPTDPRWPYLIGLHHLLTASGEVIPYLRRAYDLAASPEFKSAARLRLAESLLDRGEPDAADKLFLEELSANPTNPRAEFGLGAVAMQRGDYAAAIAHLNLAQKSPLGHRKTASLLAACHLQLGNTSEAERFDREAKAGSDDPWPDPLIAEYTRRQKGVRARLNTVEELESQGRFAEAATILEEISRVTQDDQLLSLLGSDLIKIHQYERAEKVLRTALSRNPNRATTRDYLGMSLSMQAEEKWKRGDRTGAIPLFESSLQEFRQAAKLNPKESIAHFHAGLVLKYLGKLPEAIEEYRAAISAGPQFATAHLAMGAALIEAERSAEAVPFLEDAIRLAPPNDSRAQEMLAKIRSKKP